VKGDAISPNDSPTKLGLKDTHTIDVNFAHKDDVIALRFRCHDAAADDMLLMVKRDVILW
jgi:hypothetical protein